MLKRAMQAAGFNSERLTAHSLRHTAGTNTMELTGDLYTTQQYMRHSNPATTEIYLHIDTEKKEADIAQRLYNHYHGIESQKSTREQLRETIESMTAEQLDQLHRIAAAMI
jgi:site-specific recombinase XerD